MTRDELIVNWKKATLILAAAKVNEMILRNDIIKECFENHKEEGTENVELGNDYKLKAVFKQSYTFPDKVKLDEALSKIEETGEAGKLVAERLVRYKPELSVTEYKKLDSIYRKVIDEVLITKPSTPSLELVEPKVKV